MIVTEKSISGVTHDSTDPPEYAAGPLSPEVLHSSPPVDAEVREVMIGQAYRDKLFALCARGDHDRVVKYGTSGIILAIIFFPIGLGCLLADRYARCARCGVRLESKKKRKKQGKEATP